MRKSCLQCTESTEDEGLGMGWRGFEGEGSCRLGQCYRDEYREGGIRVQ